MFFAVFGRGHIYGFAEGSVEASFAIEARFNADKDYRHIGSENQSFGMLYSEHIKTFTKIGFKD